MNSYTYIKFFSFLQFLFQTAGIVVLTLVLNGTTTKILLETLKLTEISAGRLQDMANATRQLIASQMRTLAMLKHDRFLADANWKIVEKYTTIEDPYRQVFTIGLSITLIDT